jgi:RNA polymerase sigma-70 factor (ECF subfamily)
MPPGVGNQVNIAEVYERHLDRVFAFFAFRTGQRADAEDLASATFERAVRHAARYDPRKGAESTWLLAIAENVLIDHYRRVGRRAEVSTEPDRLVGVSPATEDDHRIGLDPAVEGALALLDDRERQIVALRFGGELRAKEIAQVTGLSDANVHQILSRSLRRMGAHLR